MGGWTIALCVVLVCFSGAAARADAVAQSATYDEVSTITAAHLTIRMVKSITYKGVNYRMDSTRLDLIPYSKISSNGTLYSYLPSDQAAMRFVPDAKLPPFTSVLLDEKNQYIQGATKTGTATVAGFLCDVYTSGPSGSDGESAQVWVSRDPRFPFVVKTVSINKAQGVTDTTELENIHLNPVISDTVFSLPKDTKVMDTPPPGSSPDSSGDNSSTGAPPATTAPAPATPAK